jgi:hypothetical protein
MRVALTLLAVGATACGKNPLLARVDGQTLPECDQSVAAADGPNFAFGLRDHEEAMTLPKGPIVRIAADRSVSWRRVKAVAARIEQQGSKPVFLCGIGVTDEVAAFVPTEALHPGEHLVFDAGHEGDFFVARGNDKGTEVKAFDHEHIAKSFIRETLGPLVAESGIHDVEVRADPHMEWADLVRAVDGSRTCCEGTPMRASLIE